MLRAHKVGAASLAELQLPPVPGAGEVVSLPGDADPWAAYRAAVVKWGAVYATAGARAEWRRWALARTSPVGLTDLFWWFCAELLLQEAPSGEDFKAALLKRISTQHAMGNLVTPHASRAGGFLRAPTPPPTGGVHATHSHADMYLMALAEATHTVFIDCFPRMRELFTADFRSEIEEQLRAWFGQPPAAEGESERALLRARALWGEAWVKQNTPNARSRVRHRPFPLPSPPSRPWRRAHLPAERRVQPLQEGLQRHPVQGARAPGAPARGHRRPWCICVRGGPPGRGAQRHYQHQRRPDRGRRGLWSGGRRGTASGGGLRA